MCSVAWCSLSWEAAATLIVGLAAVLGAGTVGWMQMKILKRQTEILGAQVDLEKLKLRSDLYGKRSEVFEATKEWFNAFLTEGHIPQDERHKTFRDAIGKAEFLFRPAVAEQLSDWFRMGVDHQFHRMSGNHDRAHELALQMLAVGNQVSALFEPEMRLGEALPADPE